MGLIVSILFLSSCKKDSVDIYGSISGKVIDFGSGEPISAAVVTLSPGANTFLTSTDGSFTFSELEEGYNYTVSAQKDGYQDNYKKNITVTSGEEIKIVIPLIVRPK